MPNELFEKWRAESQEMVDNAIANSQQSKNKVHIKIDSVGAIEALVFGEEGIVSVEPCYDDQVAGKFAHRLSYPDEKRLKQLFSEKTGITDISFTDDRFIEFVMQEIEILKVIQFFFDYQWTKLKEYANQKEIKLIGDIPIFVAPDSADVWANQEEFQLDKDGRPSCVAGVPPDYFCADGQLWGNPIYDWDKMKLNKYSWWINRIKRIFELTDVLRIDHFRGFDRFYSIPASHINARHGEWVDGPKFDLFKDKLDLKIVAEDLGVIDDGVITLMRQTQYPGMKIMEFAFDGYDQNEHKPTNVPANSIIYTGTHDNMPITQYILDLDERGLEVFKKDAKSQCDAFRVAYKDETVNKLVDTLVELAFASPANTCIIPMQDLLCQGGYTRMNLPSTVSTDNWSYRVSKRKLTSRLAARLASYVDKYNR